MQLDKNYWLEPDEMQWVLHYENTYFDEKKNKNATTKNTYFYGNLSQALTGYVDKKLKKSETVENAISELKTLIEELRNINLK